MLASWGQGQYLSCSVMPQGLEQYICWVTEWVNEWCGRNFCAPGSLSVKVTVGEGTQNKQCVKLMLAWEIFLALVQEMSSINSGTAMSQSYTPFYPEDTPALEGERVMARLGTARFLPSQHGVPDFTGTGSYQKPRACFMESAGLTDASQTLFRVKNWMEILGHLSGTLHGAWFSP